jgi:hypothetical protein
MASRESKTPRNSSTRLARHLREAAEGLAEARNPKDFVAAFQASQGAWRELCHALPATVEGVPPTLLSAALTLSEKGPQGLDDYKVELLIGISRQVAQKLLNTTAPQRPIGPY